MRTTRSARTNSRVSRPVRARRIVGLGGGGGGGGGGFPDASSAPGTPTDITQGLQPDGSGIVWLPYNGVGGKSTSDIMIFAYGWQIVPSTTHSFATVGTAEMIGTFYLINDGAADVILTIAKDEWNGVDAGTSGAGIQYTGDGTIQVGIGAATLYGVGEAQYEGIDIPDDSLKAELPITQTVPATVNGWDISADTDRVVTPPSSLTPPANYDVFMAWACHDDVTTTIGAAMDHAHQASTSTGTDRATGFGISSTANYGSQTFAIADIGFHGTVFAPPIYVPGPA